VCRIEEIWKDFSFKGLNYKVSNCENIIGVSSGRFLKTRLNIDGYVCVTLGSFNEGRRVERIHRLVAKLFVYNSNPNVLTEVNHKDFDRTNNYFENLEWVTHTDNILYTVKNNRHYLPTVNLKAKIIQIMGNIH
jgi:hypothetical protein